MLDMGFRPQVDRILERMPANRQTMLFSATLEGPVDDLARTYTANASRFRADLPKEAEQGEVEHTFVAVQAEDKLDRLVEHLNAIDRLALVFVRTKHGADKLARKLGKQNISAVTLHGNMSQNQRERALAHFSSGRVSTLVATDVAARGLDVDDISHVINFDPPNSTPTTSTASAAPAAPAAAAQASPSSCPISSGTSGSSRAVSATKPRSRPQASPHRRSRGGRRRARASRRVAALADAVKDLDAAA